MKKSRIFWVRVFLAVTTILLLGCTFIFTQPYKPLKATQSQQTEMVMMQTELIPELPVRLIIPAINVDANIQYVGLSKNGDGSMGVPDNFTDVGWYKEGVRPGMRGSAVIAGHYNGKHTPRAVFYDLHSLKVGDEIIIMNAERIKNIFHVVKIKSYDYDASTTDVFISTDGKRRLNLITCEGDWMVDQKLYNRRTVVFAELQTEVK